MSQDPWSLFDDGDEVPEVTSDSGDVATTAATLVDTPDISKLTIEATSKPVTSAMKPLVSVPYQHTMPVVARFVQEHADATIEDIKSSLKSIKEVDVLDALGKLNTHLLSLQHGLGQFYPKRPQRAGKKGGKSGSHPTVAPAAEKPLLDSIITAADQLDNITWTWLVEKKAWPHVLFRECYVMGKLGKAVILAHQGHVEDAMRNVDLAMIMGVPGAELEEMIDAIEMGCIASSAARSAVNEVEYGTTAAPLPVVPPFLDESAFLDIPNITPSTAVPRVLGQGAKKEKKPVKGRGTVAEDAAASELPKEHSVLTTIRALPEGSKPLSLSDFRKTYVKNNRAVVICGTASSWPALSKWRDLNHLVEGFGHRTVPVEIGQHLSGFWEEKPMYFAEFVRQFIAPSVSWGWGKKVIRQLEEPAAISGSAEAHDTTTSSVIHPKQIGYLAQHMLFHQVPRLTEDFDVPLYAGDDVGSINAWFGTAGTVTRLHFDSYENLFTQVVGYKYVRLYAPSETPKLYPIKPTVHVSPGSPADVHEVTTSQGNVSAFDVENPDFELHPLAKDAVYTETVVGPGDILYIPKGHWHFVKGLTPSFSINFWF